MSNTYKPAIGHRVRTLADNEGVIESAEDNGHCTEYKFRTPHGMVRFNRYAIVAARYPDSSVWGAVTHTAVSSFIWMNGLPAFICKAPHKRTK